MLAIFQHIRSKKIAERTVSSKMNSIKESVNACIKEIGNTTRCIKKKLNKSEIAL